MMRLYLFIKGDVKVLGNTDEGKALAMARDGYDVIALGYASPALMPGVLAEIQSLSPNFSLNLDPVRLKPR